MRKSVFKAVLLSLILLSGVIVTSTVSFVDVQAASDKKDKKKEKEKDKEDTKKDYDFGKDHEIKQSYESLEYDSDNQYLQDQYYEGYEMKDYTAESDPYYEGYEMKDYTAESDPYYEGYQTDGYVTEQYEEQKYKSDDKIIYKNKDKKAVKNIKIIECKNVNVNADELSDLTTVESLKANNPILNKLENKLENQITGYNQYNNGIYEFYVEPDTKIIFICTNENYNLDSNENLGSTETITSFPPSAIETSESGNITTTSSSDSNENL
ncbi:MAG: hypothetical protein ACE5SW_13295, partial [Nitrososphaeraceae archaeon]